MFSGKLYAYDASFSHNSRRWWNQPTNDQPTNDATIVLSVF